MAHDVTHPWAGLVGVLYLVRLLLIEYLVRTAAVAARGF